MATLNSISSDIANIWTTQSNCSFETMQKNLFEAVRNLDYDADGPIVSNLVASPIEYPGYHISIDVVHVVLGIISEKSIEASLELGGNVVGKPLQLSAYELKPILFDNNNMAWPLVCAYHHTVKLVGVTERCKIYVVGVRVKKDKLHLLANARIPGLLRIRDGCYEADETVEAVEADEDQTNTWSSNILSNDFSMF